jgi:hypothetical protein
MNYLKELLTERADILQKEIDIKGKSKTDHVVLSEYYQIKSFLNNFDLLKSMITAINESHQRGFGDGYTDGANDMCSRM